MKVLQTVWDVLNTGYAAFFAVAAAVFIALVKFLPLDSLIVLLNGAFIGTMLAITVAYGRLFYDAMADKVRFGREMTDDVRQMVISFLACWLAYGIIVGSSFYVRAADEPVTSMLATAVSRYIAILAAVGQITAPDYGVSVFYGRDRKFLWLALGFGVLAGITAVVMQEQQTLAEGVTTEWHG